LTTNRHATVFVFVGWRRNTVIILSIWRPLLAYGHSYKASCARPG